MNTTAQNLTDIIALYRKQPASGVLLTGEKSVVLALIDELIAPGDTVLKIERTETDKNIPIDQIREVQKLTMVRSNQDQTLVICIIDAGDMSEEAQNALLKLLEEPPAGARFILTAGSPRELLKTVVSRLQLIPVPSTEETEEIPDALRSSKDFLAKPMAEQIAQLKNMSDRNDALEFLENLQKLCQLALKNVITSDSSDPKPWLKRLTITEEALSNIRDNGNVKLNLLYVITNFAGA